MEDVAHNAVMFGAFHGMGKFVDGPLKRLVFRDFEATSALGKVAFQGSRGVVLTGGDIVVMQALYAAENGKLEWSSE